MAVLREDDSPIEANTNIQNQNLSSPPPSASKVSKKVLIPGKTKVPESEDFSESSSSGTNGNVLGLVNYASDGDDDDEEAKLVECLERDGFKTIQDAIRADFR